VLYYNIY